MDPRPDPCPDDPCDRCGGSGLYVDWIGRDFTPEEREMLDSTRCHECAGTGRRLDFAE